jgi:hypothetical protein
MSDFALSVRYRRVRYQAQSDIAGHKYQLSAHLCSEGDEFSPEMKLVGE